MAAAARQRVGSGAGKASSHRTEEAITIETLQESTSAPTVNAPRRWTVDDVAFDVTTFLGITIVRGRFRDVGGYCEAGPGGTKLELTVDATSIDTGDPALDAQARSIDGFDFAQYPQVRFSSTGVSDAGHGRLHVQGRLEAAGRVLPVVFEARVKQADGGLELDGSWKVDERWLGSNGRFLPHATAHVAVHLGDTGR
ncbi:MAG TPA: YceI family protein [Gaiellaceae bacterium]|nr:YceI family protein [Gaiellaceae bacterium]